MDLKSTESKMGVFSLVFFVVAAASPLTGFVGALPIAMLLGNGAGLPSTYIVSGIILLLFAVGFVTMSKYIKNSGAFYAYISEGLGPKLGISGLSLAILTYICIYLAVAAMFGLFSQMFFHDILGIDSAWWVYTFAMLLIVCWLGIQRVEIGSKVLGVLMISEVLIALLIAGASTGHAIETNTLDFTPFSPSLLFQGGTGVALVFTMASFIGFESTAIYSEECKTPEKTIPRATVIAVLTVMTFFVFCSWGVIQTYGADNVQAEVAKNPDIFIFSVAETYFGSWISIVMNLLLITSLFAATQAFHNSIVRYFYNMSRDGLYFKQLSKLHPTKGTPHISGISGTVSMIVFFTVLALLHADPMTDIFTWGSTIATLAVLVMQILVSIAVIKYFKDRPELGEPAWKVKTLPILSIIGMGGVATVIVTNIGLVSGLESNLAYLMPIAVLIATVGGYFYAEIVKKFCPEVFISLENIVKEV